MSFIQMDYLLLQLDGSTPAVIFSYACLGRWFIFTKQVIVLFWVIFYSYLQQFFKIGVVLKTFHNSQEAPVSEFHFNQPVTCYFFNKRLRHRFFYVNFVKLSKTSFLQTTLGLLLLYLLNISVISPNLVFSPKWLFQPFETLINIEMYTCEIKITWTWEFILFLHLWFCKFVIKYG